MADRTLATSADYADALLTARRAKHVLFLLLLVILLIQLTAFTLVNRNFIQIAPAPVPAAGGAMTRAAATLPATTAAPARNVEIYMPHPVAVLRYLTGLSDFLGVALVIVLGLDLLLVINIMLVGRLIGISRVTSALIWTMLLAVLLFPWQAFLDPYWFKIPGVLYTWDELVSRGQWSDVSVNEEIQRWARFVAFPVLAAVILLSIQIKSNRGMRQALGEAGPETTQ